MDDSDAGIEQTASVWAVFGDLMSGLLGACVLILVGVLGIQLELATHLEAEVQKRQMEERRRMALEKALAIDPHIQRIAGLGQVALGHQAFRGNDAHPGAKLKS